MRIKSWNMKIEITKSRRDDILLTVGFNLRLEITAHDLQVPQGRHISQVQSAVPAGLGDRRTVILLRRLKPTVNKVPSLRDFAAPSLWEYPQYSTLDSHE